MRCLLQFAELCGVRVVSFSRHHEHLDVRGGGAGCRDPEAPGADDRQIEAFLMGGTANQVYPHRTTKVGGLPKAALLMWPPRCPVSRAGAFGAAAVPPTIAAPAVVGSSFNRGYDEA